MDTNNLFLIGGGWRPEGYSHTYGPFVEAATRDNTCKIALLIVLEADDDPDEWTVQFRSPFKILALTSDQLPTFILTKDHPLDMNALSSSEPTGIFVAGGLTPLYHELLCSDTAFREYIVSNKLVYCGFSAGASIAAKQAVVGGWKLPQNLGGLPVIDKEASEDLDEISIRTGLGLVPFAIDVHCGAWGTLTRLINAVAHDQVESGWGIDEDTMLEVNDRGLTVHGLGQAYRVDSHGTGEVTVRAFRPGDRIDPDINR